jgi:CYTH domain-containing protein
MNEIESLRILIRNRLSELTIAITSGVDNMESYKYIIGQIKTYESILQEISNLLDKKEQYEKHTGTVIDINSPKT